MSWKNYDYWGQIVDYKACCDRLSNITFQLPFVCLGKETCVDTKSWLFLAIDNLPLLQTHVCNPFELSVIKKVENEAWNNFRVDRSGGRMALMWFLELPFESLDTKLPWLSATFWIVHN